MEKVRPLIKMLPKPFIRDLDKNFKTFSREVAKDLRNEHDSVVGITGYPGVGKSQFSSLLGCSIDSNYSFSQNISFIPSSKDIENKYMNLKKYSFLHIDEASRGLHKHKWHDKLQQKLNQLYDTEREGHYLCTGLLMPRFQNFTENFRNFRIRYWVNIIARGIAIFYRRDEDKDAKDPWNLDENYKLKLKYWRGRKIYERSMGEIIRAEQRTRNYWFYCQIPEIPPKIWQVYKDLKARSRIEAAERDVELEVESYKDRLNREKKQRWAKVAELANKGLSKEEIAVSISVSTRTIQRDLKEIEAYQRLTQKTPDAATGTNNIIYNHNSNVKLKRVPEEFNKI